MDLTIHFIVTLLAAVYANRSLILQIVVIYGATIAILPLVPPGSSCEDVRVTKEIYAFYSTMIAGGA